MDVEAFGRFQGGAAQAGLVFYYSGEFDSDVVRALSSRLKQRLEAENAAGALKRKLFSVFVEMAQNVLHYGRAPVDGGAAGKPGAIGLGRDGDTWWVACGNLVEREHVQRLSGKLEALRTMTLDEIKAAYRQQLANDAHEGSDAISKGAGLGLLTIARESAHPISFEFAPDPASGGRLVYFHIKTHL